MLPLIVAGPPGYEWVVNNAIAPYVRELLSQ
jgi:hypothetical protein